MNREIVRQYENKSVSNHFRNEENKLLQMIKRYFCKNVPFLIFFHSIVKNMIMINGQKGKLKKKALKKLI